MKKDIYLDFNRNIKKRRRKRIIAIVSLVVLAVGLGTAAYLISHSLSLQAQSERSRLSAEAYEANELDEAVLQGLADMETADWSSFSAEPVTGTETVVSREAGLDNRYGIYGLWDAGIEPPEEVVDPYAEEIWMGDFVDTRERVNAKGIYVSSAYINKKLNDAIKLVDETELNAMVIDIKSDAGYITYKMDYDVAKEIGATTATIGDIAATVKKLKEHGVYLIARVVSLKDPILADKKPELALKNKDGTIFRDNSGLAWVNPYEDEVWDYLIEVCRQCVAVGFDEVNLDYIRFSTDKGMSNVDFGPGAESRTRIEVITDGIRRICEEIKPLGAFVSCDVYGAIISSSVDAKIVGQSYFNMAKYLDYICPMVYPSHYGDGYYNLDYPDCHPYELVYHALMDSQKVLYMIDPAENKAEVRPWLQDFTASWVRHHLNYGRDEVRGQISAVYDAGYSQWLLWNAGISYTEDALQKE